MPPGWMTLPCLWRLKDAHEGAAWGTWESGTRLRNADAFSAAKVKFAGEISRHAFRQWLFFRQWAAVKKYANQKGVKIIGDIPIFVAYDSCGCMVQSRFILF